jgi:bacterioferritin
VASNDEIVEVLNGVLTGELTAVNQYFVDGKMLDNWGYERLGKHFYDESIDEMKDADELIERILYLEGLPNLQRLGKLNIGQTVEEQLRSDLAVEMNAIPTLNRGIELCRAEGDNGTAELLEDILVEEEEHANWLEAQLTLIQQAGLQNYLSEQIKKDE